MIWATKYHHATGFKSLSHKAGRWWRGLDSNQRTLARADLQSAAFNHSATSPRCRQARQMAARLRCVNAGERAPLAKVPVAADLAFASSARSNPSACSRHAGIGAGEGNRTLVVSLEGFCSTIELHPLGDAPCHRPSGIVNRIGKKSQALDRLRFAPVSREQWHT